jgi:hypothetical protein
MLNMEKVLNYFMYESHYYTVGIVSLDSNG